MRDDQVICPFVLILEKTTDVVMRMPREDKEERPGGLDFQEIIREQTTCARFESGMRKYGARGSRLCSSTLVVAHGLKSGAFSFKVYVISATEHRLGSE
jgi:hypothetical protein